MKIRIAPLPIDELVDRLAQVEQQLLANPGDGYLERQREVLRLRLAQAGAEAPVAADQVPAAPEVQP